MKKIDVRGVLFDDLSMNEALEICKESLSKGRQTVIHTPNTEIVQACLEKKELFGIINSAELIVPDGIGVIRAAKILGRPFENGRLPGIELCGEILKLCEAEGKKVFLLGGKPGVAEKAASKLRNELPSLTICGTADGYFSTEGKENADLLEKIRAASPDFLVVCLGAPKQEQWIAANRKTLPGVSLLGGFGGSIDVFAGDVDRAPAFFRDHGLEWFYRLIRQPSRIGRMAKLPVFLIDTMREKKKSGKKKD